MIPDWFWEAVDTTSTEHSVEVEECEVVYRTWPAAAGARPLLLVHGMNAHSRWWDFIAPRLADTWRCVALDLTGMGDSDYRYDYTMKTWADELIAVADAGNLPTDTPIAAHSFGGRVALKAHAIAPDRFGPLVLLDSAVRSREDELKRNAERPQQRMGGADVVYPTRADAESRFRLWPPQKCDNDYVVQYIAKQSLMSIDGGWSWKFDDELLDSLVGAEGSRDWLPDALANVRSRVGVIYGAESELMEAANVEYMRALRPDDPLPAVALDAARHHLFCDQPLAFVDALKTMLADLCAAA